MPNISLFVKQCVTAVAQAICPRHLADQCMSHERNISAGLALLVRRGKGKMMEGQQGIREVEVPLPW